MIVVGQVAWRKKAIGRLEPGHLGSLRGVPHAEQNCMDEQKMEIALYFLSWKLSHGDVRRKYGISSTYAYKLKGRVMESMGGPGVIS